MGPLLPITLSFFVVYSVEIPRLGMLENRRPAEFSMAPNEGVRGGGILGSGIEVSMIGRFPFDKVPVSTSRRISELNVERLSRAVHCSAPAASISTIS